MSLILLSSYSQNYFVMLKKNFPKKGKVCKATFSLPKKAVAGAKKVELLGEFNNWNTAKPVKMTKKKDGSFSTTVELQTGRSYEFRYLIDGKKWENDWAADQYVPVSAFGIENSVISVPEVSDVPAKKAVAKKTATKKVTAKKPVAKKATAKKSPAKKVTAKKDDLKKIEGVGPKIAGLLTKSGIKTFADLAKAKITDLKKILAAAGPRYQMHNPSTWTKQAKLAAKGEWTKLDKLQDELKGGVKK